MNFIPELGPHDFAHVKVVEGVEEVVLLDGIAAGVPVGRRHVPREALVVVDLGVGSSRYDVHIEGEGKKKPKFVAEQYRVTIVVRD